MYRYSSNIHTSIWMDNHCLITKDSLKLLYDWCDEFHFPFYFCHSPPQVTRDESRHHSISGTYSRKCHEKALSSSSSSSQKLPGELSNGNMGEGEKGCTLRPIPASSAAAPCNCTTSDKML